MKERRRIGQMGIAPCPTINYIILVCSKRSSKLPFTACMLGIESRHILIILAFPGSYAQIVRWTVRGCEWMDKAPELSIFGKCIPRYRNRVE